MLVSKFLLYDMINKRLNFFGRRMWILFINRYELLIGFFFWKISSGFWFSGDGLVGRELYCFFVWIVIREVVVFFVVFRCL